MTELDSADIGEMLAATTVSEAAGFKSVSVDSLVLIAVLTELSRLRRELAEKEREAGVMWADVQRLERELVATQQARQILATDLQSLADSKPVVTMLAETVRLELAAAQAIGELEREVANASVAAYHAALECVEEEADLYRVKRRDAVRRLIAARAAAAEPMGPSQAERALIDIVLAWRRKDLSLECGPNCGCLDKLADVADEVIAARAAAGELKGG